MAKKRALLVGINRYQMPGADLRGCVSDVKDLSFDALRPGVSLTVVMDCCHSGTNTRAMNPPDAPVIPRYLPNPWDIMAAVSGRRLTGRVAGRAAFLSAEA